MGLFSIARNYFLGLSLLAGCSSGNAIPDTTDSGRPHYVNPFLDAGVSDTRKPDVPSEKLNLGTDASPSDIIEDSGPARDASLTDALRDSYTPACSDEECEEDEICVGGLCEQLFELICEEPCSLSEEYLHARARGIKRSALDLYAFAETTIASTRYPFGVRLHQDSFCGDYANFLYSMTYDIPSGVRADICMYDIERNERVGYPLDLERAAEYDISTAHEISHLLWLDRARVPYVFQEALSIGVSHFMTESSIDNFCHSYFQVENATSIVDQSRNFWFTLCNEYGFSNDMIPSLFDGIDEQRALLGRLLNLSEVKQILDDLMETDTASAFTTAEMILTPKSVGESCVYNYECQAELNCNDRRCQAVTCLDTDEGANFLQEQGTITVDRALSIDTTIADSCINESTIQEWSCDSTGGGYENFNHPCPEGTSCLDGSCQEN